VEIDSGYVDVDGGGPRGDARPLTLSEQLFVASERPDGPLTIALLSRVDGRLDADRVARAVAAVFARHPMARAQLRDRAGAQGWRILPRPVRDPVVELTARAAADVWRALEALSLRPFDLGAAPLVRVLVAHDPDGDWLGMVAHHLALDGRSLLALLTETMAAYPGPGGVAEAGETPPSHPPVPASRRVPPFRPAGGRRLRAVAGARRWVTPGSRFIAPVGRPGTPGMAFVPLVIPVPDRSTLPGGRRPTVNDLLVAAGHLAVDRWNAGRGQSSGTLRIRIAVAAASVPGAAGELGSATGQETIATSPDVRRRPAALLGAVVEQTAAAKARPPREQPGLTGRVAELLATAAPPRLRTAVLRCAVSAVRPVLMPTVVLTNVGRIPEGLTAGPGGPRLTELSFAATGGMPQGLFICVTRFGDRLYLTFCHSLELFDAAAAEAFVGLFQAALRELAAPPDLAEPAAAGSRPAARG
jgi:hypothetical protein